MRCDLRPSGSLELTTDEVFNEEIRIDVSLQCACGMVVRMEVIYFTTIPGCPANVQVEHGSHKRRFGTKTASEVTSEKLNQRLSMVCRYAECDANAVIATSITGRTPVQTVF